MLHQVHRVCHGCTIVIQAATRMLPEAFVPYFTSDSPPAASESASAKAILDLVVQDFKSKKYALGLCIDFCLLCQALQGHEPSLRHADEARNDGWLFERFKRRTHSGTKELNSLTIESGTSVHGIRKFEELVKEHFHAEGFMSYPSAYVYNTGQWSKFMVYLNGVVRLGEGGRRILVGNLIQYAKENLPKTDIRVTSARTTLSIADIFSDYPMSAPGENAGLVFQAICFGVFSLLYPGLSVSAASVRTGSRRQGRIGDIDAYEGDCLSVTSEVKDVAINSSNSEKLISQFYGDIKSLGIVAIVFCRSCDADVRDSFPEISFIDRDFIVNWSKLWEPSTYDRFVQLVLYYLSQIECSESARRRFADYMATLSL